MFPQQTCLHESIHFRFKLMFQSQLDPNLNRLLTVGAFGHFHDVIDSHLRHFSFSISLFIL